jgi:guanosine-3',5'-bis(diphosphate) 3'-pyrophosphohydrolase
VTPSRLLIEAIAFAEVAHRGQTRKDGTTPYIDHPLALMRVLACEGGIEDPDILAAAALHDVVEDCKVQPAEIEARFGSAVAALVAEVSDDTSMPTDARKAAQVARMTLASPGARLIKLADKVCNLRDIVACPPHDWSIDRKRAYFDFAAAVAHGCAGLNLALDAAFARAHSARPWRTPLPLALLVA